MKRWATIALLGAALWLPAVHTRLAQADTSVTESGFAAGLALAIDGEPMAESLRAAFVKPGQVLALSADSLSLDADLTLQTSGVGVIEQAAAARWRWRAPRAPGAYPLVIHDRANGRHRRINIFVQKPFDSRRTEIDGYRIGHYEPHGLRGDANSAPPDALIQVTPANRDMAVSAHFTLGQFLCHQQPDHWPKYLRLRPRLLEKLEHLHAALREAGIALDTITVMSGYRTPWYNADIGNTTVYSQHLFGSAADIFVDADGDGRMDDLNGDSAVDTADARWLADLVEAVVAEQPSLAGGMSVYPANAAHGPFVHIDVRGVRARW